MAHLQLGCSLVVSRPLLRLSAGHCLVLAIALVLACAAPASAAVDVTEFWDLKPEQQLRLEEAAGDSGDTERVGLLRIARAVRLVREDPVASRTLLEQVGNSGLIRYASVARWHTGVQCPLALRLSDPISVRICEAMPSLIESSDERAFRTWMTFRLGAWHYTSARYVDAVRVIKSALMSFDDLNWPVQHAGAFNNLGLTLRAQGLHGEALEQFSAGLDVLGDIEHEVVDVVRFNVGVSSMDVGLFDRARDYFDVSLARAIEIEFLLFEMTVRTYRAMLELRVGNPAAALAELEPVIDASEYEQYAGQLGHATGVYGEALMRMEREEEAFAAYERAFLLTRSATSVFQARQVRLHYARVLRLKGDLDAALAELRTLIPELRADGGRELLIRALDEQVTVMAALGLAAEIPPILDERRASERGLRDDRVSSQLALLQADFDYAAQEAELKLLRQQQATAEAEARYEQLSRYGLIAIGVLSALLVFLVTNRLNVQRQRKAERAVKAELESQVAARTADLERRIAERDKAESARRNLELRLAEDDKLRVLGQLTGGVAHDFNNLLTVISGNAELLQSRVRESEDDSVALIRSILDAVDSGAGITRSLRAYARQEPMDIQPVEMVRFLRNALPMLRRSVGSLITVRADLPREDLFVRLDPSQLTTVLLNLCLNAADAIDHTGDVLISLQPQDDRVFLMVADDGRGMSPEAAARAVEPFFSTKDESRHGGLGLSMVYGFAKQLGGELRIESELGRGTEVWISLPTADPTGAEQKESTSGSSGRLSAADQCSGGTGELR